MARNKHILSALQRVEDALAMQEQHLVGQEQQLDRQEEHLAGHEDQLAALGMCLQRMAVAVEGLGQQLRTLTYCVKEAVVVNPAPPTGGMGEEQRVVVAPEELQEKVLFEGTLDPQLHFDFHFGHDQ